MADLKFWQASKKEILRKLPTGQAEGYEDLASPDPKTDLESKVTKDQECFLKLRDRIIAKKNYQAEEIINIL